MQTEKKSRNDIIVYCVYVVLFALFIFKMFFYSNERFTVPDQRAQMSYIIYMEQNPSILVPEYSDIKMYEMGTEFTDGNQVIYEMEVQPETCYLGHPPFYYKLMQLCNTVQIAEDGTVYLNYTRLANANIILTAITMLLILMTGYKLIEKKNGSWYMHLFYVAICTTLPLYGYIGSAANNDNLCNLGIVIFWMGLVNYLDKGYTYKTFWLVACGIMVCMFAKLTSGLIVVLVTVIMILVDIIKTRKLGIVFNKYFATTIPVYAIVLTYFMKTYSKYGSFQPSYSKVSSLEEFKASSFYIAEEDRIVLTFWEDVVHFLKGLWQTWCGTYNASYMFDRSGLESFGYAVVLLFFLGCVIFEIVSFIKEKGKRNTVIIAAFGIAILLTILRQYKGHYSGYLSRGYLGGYQARYYMPCIPIVAIGACEFLFMIRQKANAAVLKIGKYLLVALSLLLVYSDFFYFVTNIYNQGIGF